MGSRANALSVRKIGCNDEANIHVESSEEESCEDNDESCEDNDENSSKLTDFSLGTGSVPED